MRRYSLLLFEALKFYETNEPRGEYVLVIEGKPRSEIEKEKQDAWETMRVEEHVNFYIEKGNDKKEAMRLAAKDRGISKRDVYQMLML